MESNDNMDSIIDKLFAKWGVFEKTINYNSIIYSFKTIFYLIYLWNGIYCLITYDTEKVRNIKIKLSYAEVD